MPTEATGELRKLAHGFEARIRIEAKKRIGFALDPGAVPDETSARARCAAMAQIAVQLRRAGHAAEAPELLRMAARARQGRGWDVVIGAVTALCSGTTSALPGQAVPTVTELLRQWTSGELAKRYPHHVRMKRSAHDDHLRATKHITPHVGDLLVSEITLDHCELVMASVPDAISTITRRHIAQVLRRVLALAVYPCRYLRENPVPRNWLPRQKNTKAKECVYPAEDAALMGCTGVPLLRRLYYGFIAREGMRSTEAASVQWRDVDLTRGKIDLDQNKTDEPRSWDLDPGVVEALNVWKESFHAEAEPSDYVFAIDRVPLSVKRNAEVLRNDLKVAGVMRPQLFERSATRLPIRVHDLRATFVTTSLASGRNETWVADRTGHRSSQQIGAYRRKARMWTGLELGSLGSLVVLIPELAALRPQSSAPALPPDAASRRKSGDALADVSRKIGNRAGMQEDHDSFLGALEESGSSSSGALPGADAVETALAEALTKAAAAGHYDVVGKLADELQARRKAREETTNVVSITKAKRR